VPSPTCGISPGPSSETGPDVVGHDGVHHHRGHHALHLRGDVFLPSPNFTSWPPQHIYRPGLVIPTVQVLVMLLSIVAMRRVERASYRMDLATVRTGLVICSC
jgi:hypothetical protein